MKKLLVLFSLLLVFVPVVARAQANWPMFRGSASLAGVAAQPLAPPLRVVWQTSIGPVESTAAIVDGTVYAATMRGRLAALSLDNGKLKWTFSSRNAFSASPCVSGGILYIGDEGGVFYALRASTGKPLYRFPTGDKIVSSATPVPGGRILFGSWDGRLYCLDAATGKQHWSFKTDAQVNATPCIVGGLAVIAGCDGKVRAIDLKTGHQRSVLVLGGNIGASAAACGGNVFVGGLNGDYLGMRVSGASRLWEVREHEEGAACYASAAATSTAVIFGSRSGRVFRVNPSTGKAAWACVTRGDVNSSPVIAGGLVWVGCDDGTLRAIDLATGKLRWQFVAGGQIKASPAIGQGCLVIGTTDGILYCLRG
jgi:outer membrane protein assembly factor BamB